MSDSSDVLSPAVLYRERQWAPWYAWLAGAALALVISGQLAYNRNIYWFFVPLVVSGAIIVWFLFWISRTEIRVEQDDAGIRWLAVEGANLPHTVVSRALVVPKSARRNALGPQLDPAAFLVSHSWVDKHVLIVLDDANDPTPYWLIAAKDPEAVIQAFAPDKEVSASAPAAHNAAE